MEEFFNDVKEFCKEIEIGWNEKERRKEIIVILEILLKENEKEKEKLNIVKRLMQNYMLVDNLMCKLRVIPDYIEYSHSGVCDVYKYMDKELDTFKSCLIASMLALVKDEELDVNYKKLMRWKNNFKK